MQDPSVSSRCSHNYVKAGNQLVVTKVLVGTSFHAHACTRPRTWI